MQYQELHQRYGSHIAKKVQAQLSFSEFRQVSLKELQSYLEARAEAAHREYQAAVDNPFSDDADRLHGLWNGAEEIARLITIAEGASRICA